MNNEADHGLNLISNHSNSSQPIHYELDGRLNGAENYQHSRMANNGDSEGYENIGQFTPAINDNVTSSIITYNSTNDDTMFAICSNLKSESDEYC